MTAVLPHGFARTGRPSDDAATLGDDEAYALCERAVSAPTDAERTEAASRLAASGIFPPLSWLIFPQSAPRPVTRPAICGRHRYGDDDACIRCGTTNPRKRKAGSSEGPAGIATARFETGNRPQEVAASQPPTTDPLVPLGPALAAAAATGPAPTEPALQDAPPASSGSVGDPLMGENAGEASPAPSARTPAGPAAPAPAAPGTSAAPGADGSPAHTDPLDELRLDWLDREERLPRATYIGSADIAMLLGCSPHGGPMDVWLAKTQPREERDEQWLRMGHRLQPAIAAEAAHVLGLRLDASEVQIRHPEGICACSLDYLAASGPGEPDTILEVKATGMWGPWRDLDEDEIPQSVLAQVQYQAAIARAAGYPIRRAFVARLLGLEVRTYEVAIDDQLGAALLEEARRFWRAHIETRTPPPADGSEAWGRWARRIRPRTPLRVATDEERCLVEEWREVRAARLEHEDREEELTQELLTVIGDAGGLEGLVAVQTRAGSPRWKDIAYAIAERAGHGVPPSLVQEHTGAGSCSLREVKVKKERKAS